MADNFRFELHGLDRIGQRYSALGQRALQAIGQALYEEAELIMGDSKERYVPVKTTALRESGHVDLPKMRGRRVEVTMGFGGPAAPYALYVHEDLTKRHGSALPPPWGPKPAEQTAKYLEIPFLQALPGISQRASDSVRQILRG